MTFVSLGREMLRLQRYIETLPDGVVELDVDSDPKALANFKLKIKPSFGPYLDTTFTISIRLRNSCCLDGVMEHEGEVNHPNITPYKYFQQLAYYTECLSLALLAEYLVHFSHYPDFEDTCGDDSFKNDQDVDLYLNKHQLNSSEEGYPYFSKEELRVPYYPSIQYINYLPKRVGYYVSFGNAEFGKADELWLKFFHFELMTMPEHPQIKYLFLEQGQHNHLYSRLTSAALIGSQPLDDNGDPVKSSTHFLSRKKVTRNLKLIFLGSVSREQSWRDSWGKWMTSHELFHYKSITKVGQADFDWEVAVLNWHTDSGRFKSLMKTHWPYALAPGCSLPLNTFEFLECREGVTDSKRASSYILFRDILKRIKTRRNLSITLIDPMMLSLRGPLLCQLEVDWAGDMNCLEWQSCKSVLTQPAQLLSCLLIWTSNLLRLASHVELYAQLGQSRPPLDVSLAPDSLYQASFTHRSLPTHCNSIPLFNGFPFMKISKILFQIAKLCLSIALPSNRINSERIFLKPYSDLYEI